MNHQIILKILEMSMQSFLTYEEVRVLKEGHIASRQRRFADRIKSILLLNKGYSYEETSDILMVDDSSVRRWYKQYLAYGIDPLIEDNYSGSSPHLLPCQARELSNHLDSNIFLTAKEAAAHVAQKYEVSYTVSGITSLLHRLGFVYKKAKKIPGKADAGKQKVFVEEYQELKTNKKLEDQIYFMDGCHPLHNSIAAYCWVKKGQEKELKSNTGRKRININGAYNIENQEVIYWEDERINAQSTCKLLEKISNHQISGMIYIIADNARYYRSKFVNQYLDKHQRVKIIFLPPYSPNLNTIERLWLVLKKKILYNKYYESFTDFRQACLS
jgi:transposase